VARPVVSTVTEELYASLIPFTESIAGMDGAATGWALLTYCQAVSKMVDKVAGYVRESDTGQPGWSSLLDLNRIPTEALDWAAQFVGVTNIAGTSDAVKRTRIASTDGYRRGTVASMTAALQAQLTGTKFVKVIERYDVDNPTLDSAYAIYFASLPAETPDQVAALNALTAQKPAGLLLRFHVTGATTDYEGLVAYQASYQVVFDSYATYGAVNTAPANYDEVGQKYATYTASIGAGTYGAVT